MESNSTNNNGSIDIPKQNEIAKKLFTIIFKIIDIESIKKYVIKNVQRLWEKSLTRKQNNLTKQKPVEQHLLEITINMIITAAIDKENLNVCQEIWQNNICKKT